MTTTLANAKEDVYESLITPYAEELFGIGEQHHDLLALETNNEDNEFVTVTATYLTYYGDHDPPNTIDMITFIIENEDVEVVDHSSEVVCYTKS
ncbi:DUF3888 domain-containing protein [Geomicrobium sp. JCM 19037]|uniref:DUF3888 domain-containing protein n=1 Tax=Geomicrobium sp. JCM 19037 TaxID=1460634 RepID=UPI0012687AFF|nr:DUF3888 domain-containing protein [Geomicrobium sp. JCM 19037]